MRAVTLDSIRAARQRISDLIYHSPCPYSLNLSRLCGAEIHCKLDHLQMTGSFKERGARNKLKLLKESGIGIQGSGPRGVVAASAGNHALALAFHGNDLGIPVAVVMPKWAPLVKVTNTRSHGATVILHGDSYDDAKAHAIRLAQEKNLTYIPGFDDPDIVAGAGTMGLEILEDVPAVDVVIVPVGGGGLIAGVGTAIKSVKPAVRIIGVEPRHAPTMHESLKRGQLAKIDVKPTLADGLAIAEAGKLCFEIARDVIDDIMLVDEREIAQSILRLLELEKTVVEGAASVPLAAAMNPEFDLRGKTVVLCLCGGNIDVTTLSRVIDRGLVADGRLARFTALISDRPGSLASLLTVIASTGASIKEVEHERPFGPVDVGWVAVVCTVETRDREHAAELHASLQDAGIQFRQ